MGNIARKNFGHGQKEINQTDRHQRSQSRGIGGYYLAGAAAGEVYDWAEGTFFTPLPEVEKP